MSDHSFKIYKMKINTEKEEQNHLAHVKSAIQKRIDSIKVELKQQSKKMAGYKEYLRENKNEKSILYSSVGLTATTGETQIAFLNKLSRLRQNPYFGRIDFDPDNQEKTIYIGINNFVSEEMKDKKNLIYDWRAPISSMFYEFGIGNAVYNSPSGKITGKINLKRQYKIRNGKMLFMLDTSEHIYDELLQKELSLSSDKKMKGIIATIQKEQNTIIRDKNFRTLIIQGVAGSGKTSIALHRVAFLFYTFKDTISSKDVLILSPNKVFSDYISNVLPELGEENIPEKNIVEIVNEFLDYQFTIQPFFEQVSQLLNGTDKIFSERVKFKSSKKFVRKLDEYGIYLNKHYFTPSDICIGKHKISQAIVSQEYASLFRFPLLKRPKKLADRLKQHLHFKKYHELSGKEKKQLEKQIRNMHGSANLKVLYKRFYSWLDRKHLLKRITKNQIEFLDAFGMAYLKMLLYGSKANEEVKHLIIDEMQDYTPIQFAIIRKMFRCKMTLLGDVDQSLAPQSKINLMEIKKSFPKSKLYTLNKSYRSTFEIISFTQKIILNKNIVPMERHGKKPSVFKEKDTDAEKEKIISLISVLTQKTKTLHSIGIICKTNQEAQIIKETLEQKQVSHHYLSQDSTKFKHGINVTCAQLSKGLEFDGVIIPFVNQLNYKNKIDRNMLYISCTRAMQQLILIYSGKPSTFIEGES